VPWPAGYASLGGSDYGGAYVERGRSTLVREARITGLAIVFGDRHSLWAGYAAKALPPNAFEPVGLSFVGASRARSRVPSVPTAVRSAIGWCTARRFGSLGSGPSCAAR
jgi:hypothetical protein